MLVIWISSKLALRARWLAVVSKFIRGLPRAARCNFQLRPLGVPGGYKLRNRFHRQLTATLFSIVGGCQWLVSGSSSVFFVLGLRPGVGRK